MFWDEVHPTEIVQEHLSNHLLPHFQQHYQFQEPKESFLQKFREGYGMKWESDCEKWDGRLRRSNIDYLNADLDTILHHGLFEKGYRTRHIMQQLGWVHANKECATNHPLLTEVYAQVASDAKKTRNVQKILSGIFSKNGSANHQAISNGDVKLENDDKESTVSQNLEDSNVLTTSEQILTEIELVDMPASSQI